MLNKTLMAVIILCLTAVSASAQDKLDTVKQTGLFVSGLVVGLLNHEAGHQLAAWATGVQLDWRIDNNNLTWFAKVPDSSHRMTPVALGGTAAEILSSEVLLNASVSKRNSFIIGWLA